MLFVHGYAMKIVTVQERYGTPTAGCVRTPMNLYRDGFLVEKPEHPSRNGGHLAMNKHLCFQWCSILCEPPEKQTWIEQSKLQSYVLIVL